jgi:hypothetical protein
MWRIQLQPVCQQVCSHTELVEGKWAGLIVGRGRERRQQKE